MAKQKRKGSSSTSTKRSKTNEATEDTTISEEIQVMEDNLLYLEKCMNKFNPAHSKKVYELGRAYLLYTRRIDLPGDKILPPVKVGSHHDAILQKTEELMKTWRLRLRLKSKLSAPDYDDEYEFNDETSQWVKLYNAKVIEYANSPGDIIELGDSSQENLTPYSLKSNESAILVHYTGYPPEHRQWFLTSDTRILPQECHLDCLSVLESHLLRRETEEEKDVHTSWICVECREAEYNSDPDIPLVICEGRCQRSFHYPCAGLPSLPDAFAKWECQDCLAMRHSCAVCKRYGKDDEEVFGCKVKECGLFFHEACLSGMYDVEMEGEGRFKCPAHHCWCCEDGMSYGGKTEPLFRCLECPNAFHLTCIPPKAKFHELALLCHDHCHYKLPDLDISQSFQGEVEAEADRLLEAQQKRQQRKKPKPKPVPKPKRGEDIFFYLPLDFKKEAHAKPPPYKHITTNSYNPTHRPKRLPPSENASCNCHNTVCTDNCLNRLLMIECIGPRTPTDPYTNCPFKEDCGNRRLRLRQVAKCRPKRESGRGWGLVGLKSIRKGDLVQEYVGEIIHEVEMKRRLEEWSIKHPGNSEYYIMQLDGCWYIDARYKGSLSRFINHSCEPNCHLVRFNVSGNIRVAVIALRDIQPGEFLSYDYRFDSRDHNRERFVCRCGAEGCRGTIKEKEKKQKRENTTETKKQLWKRSKAKYDKDLKFLQDLNKTQEERLNLTGGNVPGGKEVVAVGPHQKFRNQSYRIFLWRNVVSGADFELRCARLEKMRSWKKKDAGRKYNTDVVSLIQHHNQRLPN